MATISFRVGDRASLSRTVTEADLVAFAGVSGDFNPLHTNAEYARRSRFGQRVAHGLLSGAYLSAVLGMLLPGPGAILLSIQLHFRRPVRIGDTITATAEITSIEEDRSRVTLRTVCTNQHGEVTTEGEAVCLYEPVPTGS